MFTAITDYLVYATPTAIHGVELNPDAKSVPFSSKTDLQGLRDFDYDVTSGTVFYTTNQDQKLFKWIVGSSQASSISVLPPYNATGKAKLNR